MGCGMSGDNAKSRIPEDAMSDLAPVECGDVEITPEMIEAGTVALWEKTTLVEFPNPADRLAVKAILEAVLHVQTVD